MPNNIIDSFAKKADKSVKEVERLWDKAKGIVKKQYKDVPEEDDRFYALTTGILKKMLKLNEETRMSKFDTLIERYMRSVPLDSKEMYVDGKPQILIFSFDPNGVNTFRAAMLHDEVMITKGIKEVDSPYLPQHLISLMVYSDNPQEEDLIRELALNAGGVEYFSDGIDKAPLVSDNR
jgi:hypothetical protein